MVDIEKRISPAVHFVSGSDQQQVVVRSLLEGHRPQLLLVEVDEEVRGFAHLDRLSVPHLGVIAEVDGVPLVRVVRVFLPLQHHLVLTDGAVETLTLHE